MINKPGSNNDATTSQPSDKQEQIDFLKNEVLVKFRVNEDYDREITEMFSTNKKDANKEIDEIYKTGLDYLEKNVKSYQESRDKIGKDFFEYVAKETGYPWKYTEYNANMLTSKGGISNWDREDISNPKTSLDIGIGREKPSNELKKSEYKIVLNNEDHMRRIVAHELILSHYFGIYREHYKDAGLSDGQVWALAEIAAYALTGLTDQVKDWRPGISEQITNHNYHHIKKLQKELTDVFNRKKSFDEYMEKGIDLVKKYPDMNPDPKKMPSRQRKKIWEDWKSKYKEKIINYFRKKS